MALAKISQEDFSAILAANLTPSATIKTPERLFGRQRALKQIDRSLASQGRQVFIYGDRGVGKTSLALTAAHLLTDPSSTPLYVVCGQTDSFASVIKALGNSVVDVAHRLEKGGARSEFGGTLWGVGATFKPGHRNVPAIENPQSLNEALDLVRYVLSKVAGRVVIVIDEIERIQISGEREKFAEFIKNLPELEDRVKFIFCGVGSTLDELIGSHPSAGRILEPIELEKLHHNYLWEIVTVVADKLNITVPRDACAHKPN